MEYRTLASNLGISYQTVSKYVWYLEKSFLIKLIYNFRGSPIARARKLKKAYLASINLISGFLDSEKELFGKLPLLAENLVCLHLNAQWFWKKYTEIDFYHQKIATEVKYSETKPNIKNAILAPETLKSKTLLIITKDVEKKEKLIEFISLWKWLL